MEVSDHFFTPPPPDEPDSVQVDSCRKECHCLPKSEEASANVLGCETNFLFRFAYDGAYGGHDIIAVNRDPLVFVAHVRKSSCASGAMKSNICDTEMQCFHQTALGVSCSALANVLSLYIVFCML